ncbi:MAG: HAD-IC family P-type ATPase [Deltaproteobacteria bacterium]|nr:HAD-IC family P-type ATPase [Deltaproteobacteria bacterium]
METGPLKRHDTSFYLLSETEVLGTLSSTAEGLSEEEAARRKETFGPNALKEGKRVPRWKKFLRQFTDVLVVVLLLAAVVTAVLEPGEIDWMVIAAIVLINAVIGYLQEEKAEEAIAQLKRMQSPMAMVMRNGKRSEIPATDLVPGDIIHMESGGRVPADARLVSASSLKVNEAALTGESLPAEKTAEVLDQDVPLADRTNMVFMSTGVETGRGVAVVARTGMDTELGKIAHMIQQVERVETPLQKRLKKLGKGLGGLVLFICFLMFALELWREFNHLSIKVAVELFETAVSLAVAAIPEGLPAVVTISLAMGLKIMAKRHVIVRKLPVVETLGSATVICTDKTGTLTTGTMTADVLYTADAIWHISGTGYAPGGSFSIDGKPADPSADAATDHILRASALCADATLKEEAEQWSVLGDTTEGAIVVMAEKGGYPYKTFRSANPRKDEKPFDSKRKLMSTLHETDTGDEVAYTKGAPEAVLEICGREMTDQGEIPLSEERKSTILSLTEEMALKGYRTLGFSVSLQGQMEKDMVFLGVVGMKDKVRQEAAEAVQKAQAAGIRTIMITGDHRLTALAVGREVHLLEDESEAVNCRDLDGLSEAELNRVVQKASVFARAAPEHKVRIVSALKATGAVVGMTGDGVNDAPALKIADIGVAMGKTGTDVTKEASDMIITDDNFASIIAAVEEGRSIYDNIRKAIQFLLSCNMAEVCVMLVAIVAGWPLPFIALQILWMNLVTDAFPALALVTEPKEPDLMQRPPRNPKEGAITRDMIASILVSAGIITVGTLLVFWYNLSYLERSLAVSRTTALTTMVFFQMWTAIACRSTTHSMAKIGWFSNPRLLMAIGLSIALMMPVIYLPVAQETFQTASLGWVEWIEIALISVFGFLAVEIWEGLNRRYFHLGAANHRIRG